MNPVTEAITLRLPDRLYQRLANTAQATQRSLENVIVHALEVGSPPDWDDVPAEFQADLAALDRLDDDALWEIARSHKTADAMTRYDQLLERNQERALTDAECLELMTLRKEADRFMLCKAQAAVILRWRGHQVPSL
jgi:predicted transcriptional regulator